MLFRGGGGVAAFAAGTKLVRYFSKKRSPDVRRINPKVPREEAKAISQGLYQIIKDHGPLTVSNTWNHAKEVAIDGLNSKTHMKIMLKWMRGRQMLKLFCNQIGSAKKFLHSTLPEEPQSIKEDSSQEPVPETRKPSVQRKKKTKKVTKKRKK